MAHTSQVTEFVFYRLKPGSGQKLLDPATDEGQAVAAAAEGLRRAPGYLRSASGLKVGDEDGMVALVDWTSIEAHHAFRGSSLQNSTQAAFRPLLAAMPRFFHAPLTYATVPGTNADTLTSAPVTELAMHYYPISTTQEVQQEEVAKLLEVAAEIGRAYPKEWLYVAVGWSVEEVEREGMRDGSEKAKVLVAVVGWAGMDAYEMAIKSDLAKQIGPKLAAMGDGLEQVFVELRQA